MHFSSAHSIRSIADLSYSQQVTELNSESSSIDSRVPVGWKTQAFDGGYGWLVVLGSFTIHVFSDGFVYSFGVIGQALVEISLLRNPL